MRLPSNSDIVIAQPIARGGRNFKIHVYTTTLLLLFMIKFVTPSALKVLSRTSLTMQSPLLPWEIIERVIGYSGDHPETLFSFSLTCRQLRPRALCFMVASADFKNRDQIFDFCDFLQAKPHLKPLVLSITVILVDFAPFPLLHILPSLSKISFVSPRHHVGTHLAEDDDAGEDGISSEDSDSTEQDNDSHRGRILLPIAFNRPTFTCCQRFGSHIRTLHLDKLSFRTYREFSEILLAFTSLTHLVCSNIVVEAEGSPAPLELIKRRLSAQLHLLIVSPPACW